MWKQSMLDPRELARSHQEQAVAAWVNHLNQLRLDNLLAALHQQDIHLGDALASVDEALKKIDLDVVAANRGGVKGMHGFIAEVAEVGVGNARSEILGAGTIYEWVNDNGPVDLRRGGVDIQQTVASALAPLPNTSTSTPTFYRTVQSINFPASTSTSYDVCTTCHGRKPADC
jgi:hypothetical protein